MNDQILLKQIRLVNEQNNKDALELIIIKMQPLIKKYVRKIFFMDKDDAEQELILALIEGIHGIKKFDNEAMCLTYLQKSVINRYNFLSKKNIKYEKYIDNHNEISEEFAGKDNFNEVELYSYLNNLNISFNNNQRLIVKYFLMEYSDSEISFMIGISRQYINKFRRQLKKELSCFIDK